MPVFAVARVVVVTAVALLGVAVGAGEWLLGLGWGYC